MAGLDLIQLDAELHQLVTKERGELIHFLRRLELFDREGGCARLAKGSLFEYLVKDHHLSEPTAWRRSNAVRLLREFPQLEAPIADGRIGLTVLGVLGQVMTCENVDELIRRGTHLTKRQAEELVVSIRPRKVRADGIRKVPERNPAPSSVSAEAAPLPAASLSLVKVAAAPLPLDLGGKELEAPVERPPERASLSSAVRPVRAGPGRFRSPSTASGRRRSSGCRPSSRIGSPTATSTRSSTTCWTAPSRRSASSAAR